MKDLKRLFEESKRELDKIGIEYGNISEITVNYRAKGRWGQCRCTDCANEWEDRIYSINISNRLLEDYVSDKAVKSVIIHELLHSCKNGMKHTGEWKELAEKVNCYYSQYNIKRTNSAKELGVVDQDFIRPKEYKYILKCSCCGHEYKRMKMSESVKHPEYYRCGMCKGELIRIK